jgi:hypothetical protein
MKKVTNKLIATHLNKGLSTINGWSSKHPALLEICRLGTACKINDIDLEKLDKMIEIKEMFDLVDSIKSSQAQIDS